MKEASGELSMTLIVIVAAAAILGVFLLFKEPIFQLINEKWQTFGNQVDEQLPGSGGSGNGGSGDVDN